MKFYLLLLASTLLLGGCAQTPPVTTAATPYCNLERYVLGLDDPRQDSTLPRGDPIIRDALSNNPGKPVLMLSGGSQHGAFGAGVLSGWAEARGGDLPEFAVVTGISTGAILGSFAFADRPDLAVGGYSIERENQLLEVFAKGVTKGNIGVKGGLTAARRGAIADLIPFRERMRTFLPYDLFDDLAAAYRDKRVFLVGAVDVDAGEAVVFNMTELADRISSANARFAAGDPAAGAEREHLRNCYIEAIGASSSVPLAARPTFIDNRMYIDGGARYSLFGTENDWLRSVEAFPQPRQIYLLFNGDNLLSRKCGKTDEAACDPSSERLPLEGAHEKWSIVSVGLRSVDVLQNQVSRFSVDRAERESLASGDVNFARIVPAERDVFPVAIPDLAPGEGTKTCDAWRRLDDEIDKPFEFHPRYMRCLIAYGRARIRSTANPAGDLDWAERDR